MNSDVLSPKLQEGENSYFRTLANSAPVLLWRAATDGMCTFFNERWLRFTGRTMAQEFGNGWAEGVHPEDFQRCMHTYFDSFVEREPFEMEYRLRRADGEYRWILDLGIPHFDAGGVFCGYIGSCVDVTEQRRGREMLRQSSDELKKMIQVAPTGIIMVDESGAMVMTNSLVQSAFGYTKEELQGQPVEMLIPQRLQGSHRALRKGFLQAPRARPMGQDRDLYGRRKDGSEIPVEIGLSPLEGSDGNFVLASIVDISERRRAEEERERLTQRLQEVNGELNAALKEREALLQEVHHRVKNNLQLVHSLINMQVRRIGSSETGTALKQCGERVRTMALIHEQLYHSRDYSWVEFPEYARRLASDVLRAIDGESSHISLQLEVGDVHLPMEQAIPCGLILNELVTNSLKHAFPESRQGTIRVSIDESADTVRLEVADDGVGLNHSSGESSGSALGLQLVSTFAEQLKAKIAMSGANGTTVSVVFGRVARPMDQDPHTEVESRDVKYINR